MSIIYSAYDDNGTVDTSDRLIVVCVDRPKTPPTSEPRPPRKRTIVVPDFGPFGKGSITEVKTG